MIKRSEFFVAFARFVTDVVMIFSGIMVAYFVRIKYFLSLGIVAPDVYFLTKFPDIWSFINTAFWGTIFLIIIFITQGHYLWQREPKLVPQFERIPTSLGTGFALILVYFFFTQNPLESRFIVALSVLLSCAFLVIGRILLHSFYRMFLVRGYGRYNVLVLGGGENLSSFVQSIQQDELYNLVGVLTPEKSNKVIRKIGVYEDLEKILQKEKVEELIFVSSGTHLDLSPDIILEAQIRNIFIKVLPDTKSLDMAVVTTSTLYERPVINLVNSQMNGWQILLKDFVEIIICIVGIIILSPVFLVISILVKREAPSAPVIYKSWRVGKNFKEFPCYKFRSMVPDADDLKEKLKAQNERADGVLFKMKDDPRITKLGKFLRKTSLDELPQIFNVLRGDMSIIGPRPHLRSEVDQYPKKHHEILAIKPGITGFAQVHDKERTLSLEEEMNYQSFYMKNWSLWLDCIIFLKTIVVVLKRKNS